MGVKLGLPPIARSDARLFILGSLPGDASLAARRYYAHPTNQFWSLLGSAIGEELQSISYEERLERLAERRIGLWDVIASASRRGSLDQAIRDAEHNQVEHLLRIFRSSRRSLSTDPRPRPLGRKLIGEPSRGVALIDLPSSSAANTTGVRRKGAHPGLCWANSFSNRSLSLAPRVVGVHDRTR